MEDILITSASNSRIKEAIRIRERRRPGAENLFFIEGTKIVGMALAARVEMREVFFADHFAAKKEGGDLLRLLSETAAAVCRVADHVFAKLSDTEAPQGIAAVVSYPILSLDTLPPVSPTLCVVIDGVRDPGNLGTIIRTSDAAGADAVILLEGTCDAFSTKVIRATAGSIFNLPLALSGYDELSAWLQKRGMRIAVTAADAALSIFDADLTGPIAFVFGNEASGVRKPIRDAADLAVRIPLYGKAESLNVATAAAICLYEAVRQRTGSRIPRTL